MENGQINDLIFKELTKRGYSIKDGKKVWNIADSKLWYLTSEQAQAYLDLEQSEDYQKEVIQKEIDLINGNMDGVLDRIDGKVVNLIDIGCGDGKKAILFVNALREKGIKVRYCPIDISDYMVEKAIKTITGEDVDEIIEFQWNISDFENLGNVASLIRNQRPGINVFLLLGNTLGNFEINELLYAVRSSMVSGELLLVGNGLDNEDSSSILKSYGNEVVNNFLVRILRQIDLEESDIKFGARFENSRVELFYTLLNEKEIKFQDKTIKFDEGDEVIVSVSYKYGFDDFKGFMKIYFDDVEVHTSEDKSYALVVCKK